MAPGSSPTGDVLPFFFPMSSTTSHWVFFCLHKCIDLGNRQELQRYFRSGAKSILLGNRSQRLLDPLVCKHLACLVARLRLACLLRPVALGLLFGLGTSRENADQYNDCQSSPEHDDSSK